MVAAVLPQGCVRGRRWWAVLCLAGCLSAGCITFNDVTPTASSKERLAAKKSQSAPHVCQMVVRWHNEVVQTPNSVKGGELTPVLVGRIYLFGDTLGVPLEGDGAVGVELFDPSQIVPPGTEGTPEGGPRRLERWLIDPVALQQMKGKDMIGWGYNLLLPWGTYRPDLKRLQMRVCYEPARGNPVYETGMLVLGGTTVLEPPTVVSKSQQSAPPTNVGAVQAMQTRPTGMATAALASQSPLSVPPSPASDGTSPRNTFTPAGTLIAPGVRSWGSPALAPK